MVKVGMMIGSRYEIIEKIGTGGMSDVYKAKDHKLNRFVAVKVMKQEFSENQSFVDKFRVEAQAAAGLIHPNIVNVYDVGEDRGINFIVMELVEGITLKKYIEKKSRLSGRETISIAIQVCMGIEVAHNNGIIHRDIKPQNIIISREGKAKVTDFGIAKAATSNTITSNVMGSVHYTSPEQARGGFSDIKSDIYSMGITIFEMVTGRVPFNGETTVAIAIKHIQEEVPSPRSFVPDVPLALDRIVTKCCQKSPDRRYQSMAELIADLKYALTNPDEDFVVPYEPNMESQTRRISSEELDEIKKKTAYTEEDYYVDTEGDYYSEEPYDGEAYEEEAEDEDNDGEGEYDYDPRMERVTSILAIVIGVIFCIILLVVLFKIFGKLTDGTGESQSHIIASEESSESSIEATEFVIMPPVVGKSVEAARNALMDAGLKMNIDYREDNNVEAGVVISASVETGFSVIKGSTVDLIASAGPQGVDVPTVLGETYEVAYAELSELGFEVTKVEAYSEEVEAGLVAAQNPNPTSRVPKGTNVTITISLGKETVRSRVPNLIGKTEMDGTVELTEAKLSVGQVTGVYRNDYPYGVICYQSYSEGTFVEQGTAVDFWVSLGAEPKPQTYKCNATISSPYDEVSSYVAGSEVRLKLVADDGQVLLDTTTSSFPYSANFFNLKVAGGTLTLDYTVPGAPTTDEEGNTVPGESVAKTITRRIEFIAE